MVEFLIGDPSQTGRDYFKDFEALKGESYPMQVTFKNLMPRAVCVPEVKGLFLKSVAAAIGSELTLSVPSYEVLQRAVSSISQIAKLNHCKNAMSIKVSTGAAIGESEDTETEEAGVAVLSTTAKSKSSTTKKTTSKAKSRSRSTRKTTK